jgi:hypothetical protein
MEDISGDDLCGLINSLCENVAPQLAGIVDATLKNENNRTSMVSRRRFHWIVTRIFKNLATFDEKGEKRTSKLSAVRSFLWTKPVVDELLHMPDWNLDIIQQEVLEEMFHEISRNAEITDFLESRDYWCSIALDLFNLPIVLVGAVDRQRQRQRRNNSKKDRKPGSCDLLAFQRLGSAYFYEYERPPGTWRKGKLGVMSW